MMRGVTALANLGRGAYAAVAELGYVAALLVESLYWITAGRRRRQPVRLPPVFEQTMQVGVGAAGIAAVLSFAVGVMLAIQGIHTLKIFGAESQVVIGIALAVTREFAPLIIGILVAGRSGSALAARIGTMTVSQEVDALRVIGVEPVRYLVSPVLLAMLMMMPVLTLLADFAGLSGGAVFSALIMDMSYSAYFSRCAEVLEVNDVMQGLAKSLVFAVIITLVGAANGFQVQGGAEGVGKATTRSVVQAITWIVLADMVFTFFLNR
jgi:phospholipid/cholesterol/gamma-HCH transport system permease protein